MISGVMHEQQLSGGRDASLASTFLMPHRTMR
jgi:hypothetical protein